MPSREEIYKGIHDNTIKTLGQDDTFEFSCRQCGSCCLDRIDILLNPYDINRISKHLGVKAEEVVAKYTNVYIGDTSNVPLVQLKTISGEYKRKKRNICPFLKADGEKYKCSINGAKPIVCALYPLGRIFEFDKDGPTIGSISYFFQADTCQNKPKIHTLKQWLDESSLEGSEEASLIFSKFLADLTTEVDLKSIKETQDISDNTKDVIFNNMLYGMYIEPTQGTDFIKDLESSLDKLKNILVSLVKELADMGMSFYPKKE